MTRIIIVVLLCSATALCGCNDRGNGAKLKVGAILPLTGYGAYNAVIVKRGLDQSVRDLRAEGHEVEIVYEDSKTSPRDAITAFKRLEARGIENIIVQGGPLTMAVAPLTKGKDMILFGLATTESEFVKVTDCAVRVSPNVENMSKKIAQFNRNVLSNAQAAVVYIAQEYGKSSSTAFKVAYEELGGRIVTMEDYLTTERDFKNTLMRIRAFNPEVIHLVGVGDTIATFIRQCYGDLKFSDIQITGDLTFALPNVAANVGKLAKDLYYVDSYVSASFEDQYKDSYGEKGCSYAAYAYVIPRLLCTAKSLGYKGRRAVDYIRTQSHESVLGPLSFTSEGDAVMDLRIYKINVNNECSLAD